MVYVNGCMYYIRFSCNACIKHLSSGLLASCSSAKWTFVKNGNYTSLDQLQATSVFSLFVVHGFVDLLTTSEWVAYPDGIDYLTLVLAFLWLGLGSLHHAYTPTGSVETLQAVVQLLPAPVLIGAAFCLLVENVYRNGILPAVGRTFLIILTGSWFMHVAFVLYKPNGFPGTDVNPVYNRSDPANVRFAVAAFGLHAALVSIVMLIVYTALFVCFRRKFSKPVSSILKDEVTEGRLLMMTDSYLEQGDGDDDEDL
ncbi:transmembrane protein 45B-like [Tubulanus polymorphus]|uniref:transmembrane protein 45B-like n=1 Tax=Tubulanus polymorphus TaxID=672921 RepID=UPI003DA4418B